MTRKSRLTTALIVVVLTALLLAPLSGCTKKVQTQPGGSTSTVTQFDMKAVADNADRAINLVSALEDTLTALGKEKKIAPQAELRGHEVVIKLAKGLKDFSQRAKGYVGKADPLARANLATLLSDLAGLLGDLNATGALGITDATVRARFQTALDAVTVALNAAKILLGS